MITCLGLPVGIVESASAQDVLNQCARFLSTHQYLRETNAEFEIDGTVFCTLLDTNNDNGFVALFRTYDGFTKIGVA